MIPSALGLVAEMDSRNGASVNEASFPWVAAILAGAAAGIVAAVTRGAATWFWNSTVVKHDVSALVYLGADKEVEYFAKRTPFTTTINAFTKFVTIS